MAIGTFSIQFHLVLARKTKYIQIKTEQFVQVITKKLRTFFFKKKRNIVIGLT